MALGGAATCAKILLIIVNIMFVLSGLVLIAIGIWLLADPEVWKLVSFIVGDQSTLFRASAGLLLAMGIFILIVSALGFAGAVTESATVLGIYIGLLVVVFCGEIAGGIIAIAYRDKITREVTSSMTKSVQNTMRNGSYPYYSYNQTNNDCQSSKAGKLWDFVQVSFHCCGAGSYAMSGYENAFVNLPSTCPTLNLGANKPLTCCVQRNPTLKASTFTEDRLNQVSVVNQFDCRKIKDFGCSEAMVDWIDKNAPVLVGIGIGLGMFVMIVVIFALCLCQNREKY